MSKVALVTDSTTHLPAEIMRPYPIWEVPIMIIWGAKSCATAWIFRRTSFTARLRHSSKSPGTSQPSPQAFQEVFSRLLAEGYDILGVFISSKFSGTYASAQQAQAMLPGAKIEIINSLTGSMGAGWPVLSTARAAQAGASLAECKALVEHGAQAHRHPADGGRPAIPAPRRAHRRGAALSRDCVEIETDPGSGGERLYRTGACAHAPEGARAAGGAARGAHCGAELRYAWQRCMPAQ